MPRNYQQLAPSAQFENQLASSLYSVGFILPGSRSTVAFITRDFHALISRQHSQTNRRGLYTLFLTSKSPCMQKISSVDALLSTQNVLSRSGRFGGGHTGWSQLQLASSVSPLWIWQTLCSCVRYLHLAVFTNSQFQSSWLRCKCLTSIPSYRKYVTLAAILGTLILKPRLCIHSTASLLKIEYHQVKASDLVFNAETTGIFNYWNLILISSAFTIIAVISIK